MTSLTVEGQSMLALARANEVRCGVAQIKRKIRELPSAAGRELVAVLLENPSGHVLSMRVGVLLTAINRVGDARANKWIYRVGCWSADRQVGKMSPRQRLQLASILRERP